MKKRKFNLWAVHRFPLGDAQDPGDSMRNALDPLLDEMQALSADELQSSAWSEKKAAVVLAALPRIRALLPRIVKELPDFDVTRLDRLEVYAKALRVCQAFFFEMQIMPADLRGAVWKGARLRRRFVRSFNWLVERGELRHDDASCHSKCVGWWRLHFDLSELPHVLKYEEEKLGWSMATSGEEAKRIREQLCAIGRWRQRASDNVMIAYRGRERVYTLMSRTYEEARDAVRLVRRYQGDVDTIAPPLRSIEQKMLAGV